MMPDDPEGFFSKVFGKDGLLVRAVTAPLRWSLPTKAAWLLALALAAMVVIVWSVFLNDPNSVPWRHALSPARVAGVVLLVVVIPLVVHRLLRIWLLGDVARYADIDLAWEAGLQALQRSGLDLQQAPVFLVMGSPGEAVEKALVNASGLSFAVNAIPEGPGPLRWYANNDAVFLFCSGAGWTAALASIAEVRAKRNKGDASTFVPAAPLPSKPATPSALAPAESALVPSHGSVPMVQSPAQSAPPATPQPAAAQPAPPSPAPDAGNPMGTMMLDDFAARQAPPEAAPAAAQPAPTPTPAPAPTPSPTPPAPSPGVMNPIAGASGRYAAYQPSQPPVDSTPISVPALEAAEQVDRFAYLCQRLAAVRRPFCPLNGVLALTPLEVLVSSDREIEEFERATKADLFVLEEQTHLRAPVTSLIVGMEREKGFSELVRRVGRQRATIQRFGKGFDLRSIAMSDELAALAVHVSGAFEDWVYTLFREREALTRPGNTKLYALLCKVRSGFSARLSRLLSRGFGLDLSQEPGRMPVAFSGCYLAATGASPDRQAFVKGVIDKLIDEQEQVEWTADGLAAESRRRNAATLALIAVVGLCGLLIYLAA